MGLGSRAYGLVILDIGVLEFRFGFFVRFCLGLLARIEAVCSYDADHCRLAKCQSDGLTAWGLRATEEKRHNLSC